MTNVVGVLPSVSVVVTTYNSQRTIKKCLDQLTSLKYPREKVDIIVVDDGSIDKTVEIVKGYPAKLIQQEHNGYPSAMNAGIKVAKGEFVVIVDSDTYVSEDYLIRILDELRDPRVGIASGYVAVAPASNFWGKLVGFEAEDRYDQMKSKYVDFITSTSTAYRRRLFTEVGLFNEALKRGSDEDLAHRAFRMGWKIVLRKDAMCYHEGHSLVKYFKKQMLNMVYEVKNFLQHPELLSGKEQHPASLYIPLILTSLLILTPLWLLTNNAWVSIIALLGVILYHIPRTVRIIRKHRDWRLILLPVAVLVRYVAWLTGFVIGVFSELIHR